MKQTFALCFGNRGMFPPDVIEKSRDEVIKKLDNLGHNYILIESNRTKHGAISNIRDGRIYSEFLKENNDKIDGAIIILSNFGDESAMLEAFKYFKKPILLEAISDDYEKMDLNNRRDSFCGKISIMNVFRQSNIKYTSYQPHTIKIKDDIFSNHLDDFSKLCRIVNGMKKFTVGAIGARTTAFKTVRIDEVALENYGITVESFDLSSLINRVKNYDSKEKEGKYREKFLNYSNFKDIPSNSIDKIVKLFLSILELKEEFYLDAIALRCWDEIQLTLGISPCVIISFLNNIGIPTSCELDIGSAITMRLLNLASNNSVTSMDWNNNYKDDLDKCILYHCGPTAVSLLKDKGTVTDHMVLKNAIGEGRAYGVLQGRLKSGNITYLSIKTQNQEISIFGGEGKITNDILPDNYFGSAGVCEINNLQNVIEYIGKNGYIHHVSIGYDKHYDVIRESLSTYLNYKIDYIK